MEEKPFEKISVGDICERCDMNRKSFYYHFRDKYDLVNWIYDREFIAGVSKKEYPAAWTPGAEPFYPINTPEANACHERYKQLAAQQDRVIFGGRLADYRYYDMAPTIRCALDAARKEAQ